MACAGTMGQTGNTTSNAAASGHRTREWCDMMTSFQREQPCGAQPLTTIIAGPSGGVKRIASTLARTFDGGQLFMSAHAAAGWRVAAIVARQIDLAGNYCLAASTL